MDKITYEERVRQIAEEMAKEYCNGYWPPWQEKKEELIQLHMEYSLIAVAKMAETFRFAFKVSAYGYGNHLSDETITHQTNVFLHQYGLIPDKTETK